jgi:hypothetical protein
MGSYMSSTSNAMEILYWLPIAMDMLLLVGTYGSFCYYGMDWYFEQNDKQKANNKQAEPDKKDSLVDISPAVRERLDSLWELAMVAYSAYGCVLPWAVFTTYQYPSLRPSLSWAMTTLMAFKYVSVSWGFGGTNTASVPQQSELQKSKQNALLWFYFPTYGGYAIYKTFIEK